MIADESERDSMSALDLFATKTLLTIALAQDLKKIADSNLDLNGDDRKLFNGVVMKDGKFNSAAAECKRLMELEDNTGTKSVRKEVKRE